MTGATDRWPPSRCPDDDCGGRTLYPISNPFFDYACACTDCGRVFGWEETDDAGAGSTFESGSA